MTSFEIADEIPRNLEAIRVNKESCKRYDASACNTKPHFSMVDVTNMIYAHSHDL